MPRYIQISDLFRHRISRGQWKVGDQLPTLEALVDDFNVSRVTIRQAVDVLTREGLVMPQQGRGTFVTVAPKIDHWLKVEKTRDDLVEVYRDSRPEILNIALSTRHPALADTEASDVPQLAVRYRPQTPSLQRTGFGLGHGLAGLCQPGLVHKNKNICYRVISIKNKFEAF